MPVHCTKRRSLLRRTDPFISFWAALTRGPPSVWEGLPSCKRQFKHSLRPTRKHGLENADCLVPLSVRQSLALYTAAGLMSPAHPLLDTFARLASKIRRPVLLCMSRPVTGRAGRGIRSRLLRRLGFANGVVPSANPHVAAV